MAIKKAILKKTVRGVGSRFNLYSEEDSTTESELQGTVEKIAEKVDSDTGRVEKSGRSGIAGALRAVKDKNHWYIEIKTEDGWIRSSNSTPSGFILRDKSS